MKSTTATGCLEFLVTKLFPIGISLVALFLSTFNLYINYLKSPEISFVVAPSIIHLVDNDSSNETFFIPLTMINRGARPGTVTAFELTVTHLPTQKQANYFGQYYAKKDEQKTTGDLFSPVTLDGYSTSSNTVCFYPIGARAGNFFAEAEAYEFTLTAVIANVRNEFQKSLPRTFRITLTDDSRPSCRPSLMANIFTL